MTPVTRVCQKKREKIIHWTEEHERENHAIIGTIFEVDFIEDYGMKTV